ncbi:MAG: hypothetical protein Q8R79_00390 [Legionellaceae bacterium]|nr:hypothetical protein [Legionellaceae bacterium]
MKSNFPNRYLISSFSWPIIIGIMFFADFFKNNFYCVVKIPTIIMVFLLTYQTVNLVKKNGVSLDLYPHDVACIDKFLKKENLQYGIAQYWDAKYIQAFSRQSLVLAQHSPALEEQRHMTSNVFFRPLYDFAIISKYAPPPYIISQEKLLAINGYPKKTAICKNHILLIYGKRKMKVRPTIKNLVSLPP